MNLAPGTQVTFRPPAADDRVYEVVQYLTDPEGLFVELGGGMYPMIAAVDDVEAAE